MSFFFQPDNVEIGNLVEANELREYLLSTSKAVSLALIRGSSGLHCLANESPIDDIEAHIKTDQ